MANSALPQPSPSKARVTIVDPSLGDRVFEAPVAGDGLGRVLDILQSGAGGDGFIGFGPLLAAAVLQQVFAGATAITLDSLPGTRLLALCKAAAADPFAIETWLADLDATVGKHEPVGGTHGLI